MVRAGWLLGGGVALLVLSAFPSAVGAQNPIVQRQLALARLQQQHYQMALLQQYRLAALKRAATVPIGPRARFVPPAAALILPRAAARPAGAGQTSALRNANLQTALAAANVSASTRFQRSMMNTAVGAWNLAALQRLYQRQLTRAGGSPNQPNYSQTNSWRQMSSQLSYLGQPWSQDSLRQRQLSRQWTFLNRAGGVRGTFRDRRTLQSFNEASPLGLLRVRRVAAVREWIDPNQPPGSPGARRRQVVSRSVYQFSPSLLWWALQAQALQQMGPQYQVTLIPISYD